MGSRNTITLLIASMLFFCFFTASSNALSTTEKIEEDAFASLFEKKPVNFVLLNDVWTLKNNIDDLSLKKSINAEFVPGEVIVKFNDEALKNGKLDVLGNQLSTGVPSLDSFNKDYELLDVEKVSNFETPHVLENVYKFRFPKDSDVSTIVEYYENDKNIEYAEPNYLFNLLNTPNDPYFSQQWALNQLNDCDIDAPEAWDIETGDENIIIAIVDTGIDYNHSDLTDNIWNNSSCFNHNSSAI